MRALLSRDGEQAPVPDRSAELRNYAALPLAKPTRGLLRWSLALIAALSLSTVLGAGPGVATDLREGKVSAGAATVLQNATGTVRIEQPRLDASGRPVFVVPGAPDSDGDGVENSLDNCPTLANAGQAGGDSNLVGDVCDNCTGVANPRVTSAFLTANPWLTMTGGQRDDDHDGFGNKCEAKFVGLATTAVGALDVNQFRASNGETRDVDTCGTTGTRPCAIFDLDENTTTANAIGALDLNRFRALNGLVPAPKCPTCPLTCAAGTAGSCF
jgi:hypothetical protein